MSSDKQNTSVTIFIPAYNEEKNIENAVRSAIKAVETKFNDYEILLLNACSTDKTGFIVDNIAIKNKKIKVIHRKNWYGLGANYMYGAQMATMEYFVLFPGDNEITGDSLATLLTMIGEADIIIPYTINMEVRSFHRRIISKAFVSLLNVLFNLSLQYYNGNTLYKTKILNNLTINSEDFAYNAEILVKLLKRGYSYVEVGMTIKPITNKTAIFNIKNIIGVIKTVILLYHDVYITNRYRYR